MKIRFSTLAAAASKSRVIDVFRSKRVIEKCRRGKTKIDRPTKKQCVMSPRCLFEEKRTYLENIDMNYSTATPLWIC